ncbi:MAG: response regulator transcription factor [Anaerolineae bacterium]|nr:response regulator transcription factor [Anaerolineae bacterium]
MTKQISVLICDDQAVVREGLAAILGTVPHIRVAALASHGQEAVDMVAHTQPDVVLMDLNMPVMNGVQATRFIRQQFPGVNVLVLTTYATDEWVFDAIRAGASGYLLKDTRRDDLVRAIEGTAQGKAHLDPEVAGKIMTHIAQTPTLSPTIPSLDLPEALTLREQEVLRLLAQGLSNPEIAGQLHLSPGTVRNYVSEIFTKLGVSDRAQAAIAAVKLGLLGA